ncbi:hypothetical protein BCV70DRAFT_199033 [Testicularia cyperi]|uniref:Uncharacterized protein n=1 Tax=Testicularia cyperi TaxID=1882483 RepID=A0A317XU70_9BASI|nr:hypothetical protein BCV70DRAFT_199033 [Testicularia cyperi]
MARTSFDTVDAKGKRRARDDELTKGAQSDEEQAQRLAQLEAFGHDFMSAFEMPEAQPASQSRLSDKKAASKKKRKRPQSESTTVAHFSTPETRPIRPEDEVDTLFEASSTSTGRPNTSAATKRAKQARPVETIVFGSEAKPDVSEQKASKQGWKAFMSSKIEKIDKTADSIEASSLNDAERQEEKQLVANDRLLSELLSTTLFAPGSGGANGKQNLSSNDTLARIMELSATETQRKGQAIGRGWGEKEFKRQQLSKMPAAIRQGMRKAAGERRDKERDKAKELGTWHPSMKHSYSNQATVTERGNKKETGKRQRGMAVGIGKFQGGMLKLSAQEISSINGKPKKASGGGKGNKKTGGKRRD